MGPTSLVRTWGGGGGVGRGCKKPGPHKHSIMHHDHKKQSFLFCCRDASPAHALPAALPGSATLCAHTIHPAQPQQDHSTLTLRPTRPRTPPPPPPPLTLDQMPSAPMSMSPSNTRPSSQMARTVCRPVAGSVTCGHFAEILGYCSGNQVVSFNVGHASTAQRSMQSAARRTSW